MATSVTDGDKIYFVLNAKADQNYDSTEWQPTLTEDFLAGWMAAQFSSSQLADPSISGYSANPDDDTLPTLLEFVMGTGPLQAEPTPIVVLPTAQFSFPRRKDLGDVTVTAQFSSDLTTWVDQPVPAGVQDAGALEMVTYAAPGGMQPSPALFFRVYATVNPN